MSSAVAMIEVKSIAKGIALCDLMLKTAEVDLLISEVRCICRYVIMVGGESSAVESCYKTAIEYGEKSIVDKFFLSKLHSDVLTTMKKKKKTTQNQAIGIVEYKTMASTIQSADKALKSSDVTLIQIQLGVRLGGKGFFIITGDISSVKTAVETVSETDKYIDSVVLASPDLALLKHL